VARLRALRRGGARRTSIYRRRRTSTRWSDRCSSRGFKMAYAIETRDLPVYHLIRARADVRAGPRLGPASKPCDRSPIGVNVPAPNPTRSPLRSAVRAQHRWSEDRGLGATLDELAHRLSGAGPADRRQPDRARRRVRLRAGVHAGQPGGRRKRRATPASPSSPRFRSSSVCASESARGSVGRPRHSSPRTGRKRTK
jgi:hypothetical protein